MGFLDGLKDKAEQFGEKAKDSFEAAKEKAGELIEDVKERMDDKDDSEGAVSADSTQGDFTAATDDTASYSAEAADTSSAADDGAVEDRYDEVLDAAQDRAQSNPTDPPTS